MSRNQYTVARKSIWFVLRTLLIIVALIVAALYVFIGAMHVSNIYILVSEGMEKRAECILEGGSVNELTEYFTQDFVSKDAALYNDRYVNYTVTNFIYKLDVNSLLVLPWDTSASMKVTERLLSLSGTPNEGLPEDAKLPAWTPARYSVKLRRMNGRWYISDMILLQENPAEAPKPTPDMNLMPTP
ncbi:MAG: hypothetical protein EOM66_10430 [Clostridia bacterium]|nr:hypothetical protein [Clostridia bacterium]